MRINQCMALAKLRRDVPDDPAPHGVPEAVRALPHEAPVRRRLRDIAVAAHRRVEGVEPDARDVLDERQHQLDLQHKRMTCGFLERGL